MATTPDIYAKLTELGEPLPLPGRWRRHVLREPLLHRLPPDPTVVLDLVRQQFDEPAVAQSGIMRQHSNGKLLLAGTEFLGIQKKPLAPQEFDSFASAKISETPLGQFEGLLKQQVTLSRAIVAHRRHITDNDP